MASNNLTIRDKELLEKLTHIVLDNLSNEQFGVSELSDEIGLNRSHLFRKVKLLKSQSISQFIREVRLKEAFKQLVNEGLLLKLLIRWDLMILRILINVSICFLVFRLEKQNNTFQKSFGENY
jgi:AraC-like DNA-binding protein